MSLPCRRRARLPARRWALLVWDLVGGWDVARTATTRLGAFRGYEFLKTDYAIVRILTVAPMEPCECDRCKTRRLHWHPCPEKGCLQKHACGRAECKRRRRESKVPGYICRRCSWRRDFGKMPTEAEVKQYRMDEQDATP